jgi:AmmeMemoRadiSam system protein A
MLQLSEDDRRYLLQLARRSIEECLTSGHASPVTPPEGAVRKEAAAFVTLRRGEELRGCIGHLAPPRPLYQTVQECALAAAFGDPRFPPLAASELPEIHIEISVLSDLEDIDPEKVEVGRHGLLVSLGPRRGLLLPQVATQWGWDRWRFLEETCLKAELPPDAWRRGARVQAFTADVFGEMEERATAAG